MVAATTWRRRPPTRVFPAGQSGPAGPAEPFGSTRRQPPLRIHRLAPRQHGHEVLDAPRSGLRPLGLADPLEHGVAVLAGQDLEHRLGVRVERQRVGQIRRDFHLGPTSTGRLPASIGASPLHRR